ncbi:ATP-binding protein [Virgisporangium aliadipatigenens]|uniref:ATP-binding protein n=1 Tax=Virgisporangium aliadipatigenens TaxID=741659 RepID=UPI001941C13C|nr:ATP-binding protein [Virgisporangium aliadipatigenens]
MDAGAADPARGGREPARETTRVTVADIGELRRRLIAAACAAGMGRERADLFTVAVNEIVINAVQYGGGAADVTITDRGDRIVVDVRDQGGLAAVVVPAALPPADQIHGRGLWLARRLCDEVTVTPSAVGTHVTLTAALPDG